MHRRGLLGLAGTGAVAALFPGAAAASVSRAVRLEQLVGRSRHVMVGEPLDAYSVWEAIGGRKHIVSYTRVRVRELMAGADPGADEVLIRTLGGRVGTLGELVHGEARLPLGSRGVLFVMPVGGTLAVTAMAQGHYPLRRDGAAVDWLERSPAAVELLNEAGSAVQRLPGLRLEEARSLLRGMVQK